MRKLVVLMLVLGMASLANASLVLTVNGVAAPLQIAVAPGTSIILGVESTTDSSLSYVDVLKDGGAFVLGEPVKGAAAGDIGGVSALSDIGTAMEIVVTQAWSGAGVAGVVGTIALTYNGGGDVVVQLWDDAIGYAEPAQTLTITPEPATLAILGLGGLLLRRKKA